MITKVDKIVFVIILAFLVLTIVFWKEVKSMLGPATEVNEVDIKKKKDKKKDKKEKKDKKDNALMIESEIMLAKKSRFYIAGPTAYILKTGETLFEVIYYPG